MATRFILVRAECPYVQLAAARVVSTKKKVRNRGYKRSKDGQVPSLLWKGRKNAKSSVAAWLCVMCGIDPSSSV